jgi:hypothetical protein
MTRLAPMLDRLPPPLRADAAGLIGRLLAVVDAELSSLDEDMERVRRTRFVETALDLEDLAKLGALFGLGPEPWEPAEMFRARLRTTIAARLAGAVTRTPLDDVLAGLLDGAQTALGARYASLARGAGGRVFRDPAAVTRTGQPRFDEFPPRRARSPALAARGGRMRPLDRIVLENRGVHAAPLEGVVRGVIGRRAAVPLLANLTTGRVVAFRGVLSAGAELRLIARNGRLEARLDGREASARLITAEGFRLGAALPLPAEQTPRPIQLAPGANEIFFLPLAIYGERILDRGALAMPDERVRHGLFGDSATPGTAFDDSLFEQQPSAALDLFWTEAAPATFRFVVPAGVVRHEPSGADRLAERAALDALMDATVRLLRAAGVDGQVSFVPLRETQRQSDLGRAINPRLPPDTQLPAQVRLAGVTALFDETAREGGRLA